MTITLDEFYKKYGLDNFERNVPINKMELFEDLQKILRQICNFLDVLTTQNTKWCGEIILSAAHCSRKYPPVKNQIAKCMGIPASNLKTSYEHLINNHYVKIEKDNDRRRVTLNYEEFPEFKLITKLMEDFWKCRKERIKDLQAWREGK